MPDTQIQEAEAYVQGILDEMYGDDWRPKEQIVQRVVTYIRNEELIPLIGREQDNQDKLRSVVLNLLAFAGEGY